MEKYRQWLVGVGVGVDDGGGGVAYTAQLVSVVHAPC